MLSVGAPPAVLCCSAQEGCAHKVVDKRTWCCQAFPTLRVPRLQCTGGSTVGQIPSLCVATLLAQRRVPPTLAARSPMSRGTWTHSWMPRHMRRSAPTDLSSAARGTQHGLCVLGAAALVAAAASAACSEQQQQQQQQCVGACLHLGITCAWAFVHRGARAAGRGPRGSAASSCASTH